MISALANGTLAILGCWSIWLWIREFRGRGLLGSRRGYLMPLGILDLIALLFLMMVIQSILAGALASGTPDGTVSPDISSSASPSAPNLLVPMVSSVFQVVLVLLASGWLCWPYRQSIRELLATGGLRRWELWRLSIEAWVLVLPPVLLIHSLISQWIPYEHPTLDQMSQANDVRVWLVQWLGAVLAAPLFEEFFYRGLLIHWMTHATLASWNNFERVVLGNWLVPAEADQRYSAQAPQWELTPAWLSTGWASPSLASWGWLLVYWGPIVASAALFGLAHWGQGMAAVPLFLLGVFLGVLSRQTRSLWPCILVHCAFNGYTMFWVTLSAWFTGAT